MRSPQFWAPEVYRAKVKTPFEYVVSSLRATNSDVTETQPLLNQLNKMGMQIYGMQPPTGYSTNADTWVNSAALLDRMNFALQLVNNQIAGTHFDATTLLHDTTGSDSYAAQVQLEQLCWREPSRLKLTIPSSAKSPRPRAQAVSQPPIQKHQYHGGVTVRFAGVSAPLSF